MGGNGRVDVRARRPGVSDLPAVSTPRADIWVRTR